MRALAIQHNETELPGLVGERAAELGVEIEALVVSDDTVFPDPREFDLLIPLGAPESVRDPEVPWIPPELAMLRRAVDHDVPVLGICFGAQMLAHVLGGQVRPATEPEIGWTRIQSFDTALIGSDEWFELHFDVFTLPPGARELARNGAGTQAFSIGRHLGVQFHPEIDATILELWTSRWAALFDELGVDTGQLIEATRRRHDQARTATYQLFDEWLARIAPGR